MVAFITVAGTLAVGFFVARKIILRNLEWKHLKQLHSLCTDELTREVLNKKRVTAKTKDLIDCYKSICFLARLMKEEGIINPEMLRTIEERLEKLRN